MFGEEKNLKVSSGGSGMTITDTPTSLSYTKTHKLIMALYMVTDIMDKDEPLRNKLRTLGTGIISDTYSIERNSIGQTATLILSKISELLSFLEIARALTIISEMNCNILTKEFSLLDHSVKESMGEVKNFNHHVDLSELFKEDDSALSKTFSKPHYEPHTTIGHPNPTRIGVQKGSTLLKALSDKNLGRSLGSSTSMSDKSLSTAAINFDLLKKQRRDEIKDSILANGGNATIKDIKDKAQGQLKNCGEKTLQRELISMVQNGVLNRAGEKRWSRYFLKN